MSEFSDLELYLIRQLVLNEIGELKEYLKVHISEGNTIYNQAYVNRIHHCESILGKLDRMKAATFYTPLNGVVELARD